MAELDWIRKLQTPFPLGLNDSIYQSGNISKNPDIDVFSIFFLLGNVNRDHTVFVRMVILSVKHDFICPFLIYIFYV